MRIRAKARPDGLRNISEKKIAGIIDPDSGNKYLDIRDFVGHLGLNAGNRTEFMFLNEIWRTYAPGGEKRRIVIYDENNKKVAEFKNCEYKLARK